MNKKRRTVIGVMGGAHCNPATEKIAHEMGRLIAETGYVLLSGGRPAGVMQAASLGASSAGGLVIGVLSSDRPQDANDFVDIAIASGIGDARNLINVLTSDVIIACQGRAGTLSEIALAIKNNTPVILLDFDPGPAFDWAQNEGLLFRAQTPQQAKKLLSHALGAKPDSK